MLIGLPIPANYLFSVVYSFTYTPLQGVYPAENLTSTTRAKGLAASGIIVSLFGFINTYAGPIALERMKNRYIFVFVVWDLIETVIWWFCGVETVGRTIEECVDVKRSRSETYVLKLFVFIDWTRSTTRTTLLLPRERRLPLPRPATIPSFRSPSRQSQALCLDDAPPRESYFGVCHTCYKTVKVDCICLWKYDVLNHDL